MHEKQRKKEYFVKIVRTMKERKLTMKLYHGTTTERYKQIQQEGLTKPFLTNDEELAMYYAEGVGEEEVGEPIILEVEANEEGLRYDGAAVDEPVRFGDFSIAELEEKRSCMWEEQSRLHPEWLKTYSEKRAFILIPKEAYRLSLETVGSCWYEGIVSPENIQIIE